MNALSCSSSYPPSISQATTTVASKLCINTQNVFDSPLLKSRQNGSIVSHLWKTDRQIYVFRWKLVLDIRRGSVSNCSPIKRFSFLFFLASSFLKNRQSPVADQSVESSPFWGLGNPGFLWFHGNRKESSAWTSKRDFLMLAGTFQDNAFTARGLLSGCFHYVAGFNTTLFRGFAGASFKNATLNIIRVSHTGGTC